MLPSKIIYSERTILRQLTEADAADFYALNADEEVLKYTGDKSFKNIEEAREFLRNYNQYKLYGVGRMAVIDKTSGKLMGWCGLKYHEQSNEFDIGFRFFKHYWNMGYATETAKACIEYEQEIHQMKRMIGRAMLANKASLKVLQKLGFEFHAHVNFDGHEGAIYERLF
jgi:RimJ/RimL family protein N-acetyltransferase